MIRSPSALRAAREAFEDGKSAFVDENGELMAAGKALPSDEPSSHEFLVWHSSPKKSALDDISNGSRRQAVQALSGSSVSALLREETEPKVEKEEEEASPTEPPFASGGLWDVEPDAPEEAIAETPVIEEEQPTPSVEDKEIVEAKPPRRRRKKKSAQQQPVVHRRRWLVINQPVTEQKDVVTHRSAAAARKLHKVKKPREHFATSSRHFPRSPLLYNERFPPTSPTFETEYSDEFAWPQTPIRLR